MRKGGVKFNNLESTGDRASRKWIGNTIGRERSRKEGGKNYTTGQTLVKNHSHETQA